VRTARRTTAAVAAVLLLALASVGTAPAAPQAVSPQCVRLGNSIDQLESTHDALTAVIAQLQQQIASGRLRPAQVRVAQALVIGLQWQLTRVDAALDRLSDRYAELCTDDGGEVPPPPPPPGDE
jgi:TolA-binding protein